ncbi:MAG: ribonuclease P protein component [Bacteroidales bacterium]|nr:ribonuclease P protein component [Bacteroidales bacterium]MBN2764321.1 ribonuclease P protein component [Bacteroidales bacterium]
MAFGKTFKKAERLSLKTHIDALFSSGATISLYPLKFIFLPAPASFHYPAQVMFTVSTRRFKKAVDRNRIKRKIKEAYRQHKHFLYEELKKQNRQLFVCIMYTGSDQLPQAELLNSKLNKGVKMLIQSCRSFG